MSQQVNMEVFHGFTLTDWENMESYANQAGLYPKPDLKTATQPNSLLAYTSSLNCDVECSEGECNYYLQQANNPAVPSPGNGMNELWLDQFMPLDQLTSTGDGLPPTSTYDSTTMTIGAAAAHFPGSDGCYSAADGLYSSADRYASANMVYSPTDVDYSVLLTPESQHSYRHPGSPQSQGTLDGSDFSDLLDDLPCEPNRMYTFSPSGIEERPQEGQSPFSTLEELLLSPTKMHCIPEYNPAAPPLPLGEQLGVVSAKDISGMDDINKLLQAPLPAQGPIPKVWSKAADRQRWSYKVGEEAAQERTEQDCCIALSSTEARGARDA